MVKNSCGFTIFGGDAGSHRCEIQFNVSTSLIVKYAIVKNNVFLVDKTS